MRIHSASLVGNSEPDFQPTRDSSCSFFRNVEAFLPFRPGVAATYVLALKRHRTNLHRAGQATRLLPNVVGIVAPGDHLIPNARRFGDRAFNASGVMNTVWIIRRISP